MCCLTPAAGSFTSPPLRSGWGKGLALFAQLLNLPRTGGGHKAAQGRPSALLLPCWAAADQADFHYIRSTGRGMIPIVALLNTHWISRLRSASLPKAGLDILYLSSSLNHLYLTQRKKFDFLGHRTLLCAAVDYSQAMAKFAAVMNAKHWLWSISTGLVPTSYIGMQMHIRTYWKSFKKEGRCRQPSQFKGRPMIGQVVKPWKNWGYIFMETEL